MSEGKISLRRMIPVIVVTWILSFVTMLAFVYFAPLVPIGADKIAEEAIVTTRLADGSVSSAKLVDGTIVAQDLADGSITMVKVEDGAIVTAKIADGSIVASKLTDNAIVTVKMADGSVTTAKILDGTITTADLADGSLTSVKIANGAVTTAKIADYSVTGLKLAPGSVPFAYVTPTTLASTTSWAFVDMADTNVTISLARTSHLLIIFTYEARVNPAGGVIYLQAVVGVDSALPDSNGYGQIPPNTQENPYTYMFYKPSVAAGTYSVKIRWLVTMNTAYAGKRALTVIALPA